jgi:plastocyanin
VTRTLAVAGHLLVAGLATLGCTDDSGSGNPGTGGSSAGAAGTGGTTGAAGSGGGGGGASGGTGGSTPGFMSIAPCRNESDYMAATTVTFPVSATDFNYAPKCLLVTLPATGGPGVDVTFSGDFVAHPLEPSALRGAQSGNPITATSAGTSKVFRFSTPGFFAYFCETHNPSDNGAAMSGVVWVTQQIILP